MFDDLEKTYLAIFGENVSTFWRNRSATLERTVRRYWREPFDNIGENRSAITLEIWRNVVGTIMAISYWNSLWSSIELGDHKWGLNLNVEKVETGYGDQNFIQHKVESTYLEHFKDRNI